MTFESDLLEQAKDLAEKEPQKPKQASLKRAVSAAYYALFHFLVSEAASFMVKGTGQKGIRLVFQRAFVHGHMKKVAVSFAGGTVPDHWKGPMARQPVSRELKQVSTAFVDLQAARHEADYDLTHHLSRKDALDLIERSKRAITAWRKIRGTLEANVFLAALLVNERIPKS